MKPTAASDACRAAAAAHRPRIGVGLALVGAQTLVMFVMLGLVGPAVIDGSPFDPSPRVFFLLGVAVLASSGGVVGLGIVRAAKVPLAQLGWTFRTLPRDLPFALVGATAMLAIVTGLYATMGGLEGVRELAAEIVSHRPAQVALFAGVGVQAAFVEESVFRGYLQPAMIDRFGFVAGLVGTAAIFSVYHLPSGPFPFLGRFGAGVVLGLLRGRDRSLVGPALAHALTWIVLGPA